MIQASAARDLAARLDTVTGSRERAAIRREFAALHGVSETTVSRVLCEVGHRRFARADRGVRRREVPADALEKVIAMQRASLSLKKGVVMPSGVALEIARDSGFVEGDLSASTYSRWLRHDAMSREDQARPEPHVTLRSLGPNHVHQFDWSRAVSWRLDGAALQYQHLDYKNKELAGPGLWRGITTDHASGCIAVRYAVTTGETVQATLECLYHAWAPKRIGEESLDRIYPFRGVPQILMVDRGSANRAHITAGVLETLGVRLNICEGARSKGSVETSHNWWETHFESRMRLQPPASIEQLNEWAVDFAAKLCQHRHGRHGAGRSEMWSWHIGRNEHSRLRELRCDWETFKSIAVSEPQRCHVAGNRVIRFKGQQYRVPEQIAALSHVLVHYSAFDFPRVLVRAEGDLATAPAWLCEPVELDTFGFPVDAPVIGENYRSPKQTATAKAVKQADEVARELTEQGKVRAFGHHRQKLTPVQRRAVGEEVLVEAGAGAVMTRFQARQELAARIGRSFTAAEADHVNAAWSHDAVTTAEVDAMVATLRAGVTGKLFVMGA